MSTISGCSGSSQLSAVRQNDPREQQRRADFETALLAGGADASKVDTIQSQIQQAIADAIKQGGSTEQERPDSSTIKSAVQSVLKANGIDVTKFEASLEASKATHAGGAHKHRHGHRAASSSDAVANAASQLFQDNPSKGNQIDTAA